MADNLWGMIMDMSDSDSDVSDMIMLNMLSQLSNDTSDEDSNQSENGDDSSETDERSSYSESTTVRDGGASYEAPVPDPQCSLCSKAITGFVFVCVQCNVRVCGACDAQGRHALHYVLRAPSGSPEEELKMVLSRVYEAISLAGLSTPEQPAEHTEGQQDDGGIELKTEIKLEVDIEDKDPFGGPEYEEPFLSTTVQAGGSQVVPEQIEIKSEPSEPDTSATHKETDFYVNSAKSTSRRRSVTSFRSTLDSDDSQPLAKRRHISSDTESKYETFPTHTPKKQTTIPDERKSTTDPNADPGSPSVAASPSRIKEV